MDFPEPNSVLERCDSTNDIARRLGEAGAPHGSWIAARRQTAGRGRLGREWVSEEGNLFLSVLLRPRRGFQYWGWIPLMAGVAAARAIDTVKPESSLRVKWPNDLWIGEAKVGGILCEASGGNAASWVVVGIGLNCRSAPAGLDQTTTSLGISADQLRPVLIDYLLLEFQTLQDYGPDSTREAFESRALLKPETPVQWSNHSGAHEGRVIGLGEAGELLVRENGAVVGLFAEDVRTRLSCPL